MGLLDKLFRREKKPDVPDLPRGIEQTQDEQDASRDIMERQVADDRKRRGEKD